MSHLFNLIVIENQIIKDKLANLYSSMDNILGQKSENSAKDEVIEKLIKYAKKLQEAYETSEKKYLEIIMIRDDMKYRMEQLSEAKNLLANDQEKVLSKNKEKMLRMKELNDSLTEEREKLKAKLETSEYNYKILSEEYEKLRQRVKQVKFRQVEAEEEKVCKNCKKIYKEEENYNWSCKIHSSQYSGIWWCCGKKDKNALGCKVCMHESKEEYDNIIKDDVLVTTDKKVLCTSCKHNGHTFTECPKDPNARTTNDISDEIERLAILNQQISLKTSKISDCSPVKQNTIQLRNSKIRQYMEQQYNSEDIDEDEDGEQFLKTQNNDNFFPDLMALKSNTVFDTDCTRYKITSEIGESPFMVRKLKSQKRTKKQGQTLFANDRVSTLVKTITLVD
ncbi:hypothetical protein SteCoe_7310 [Stentor coeruleus]|uniref:Uncharacterized protein n=1 Tax=Stentor coeruleus TaxID=5963 RepID=A0A1R2CN30_9CILI|nr:hypothetical protein SteCoe_7310 [Stentor coeruleus]